MDLQKTKHDAMIKLEYEIAKLPPANIEMRHYFANGVYVREMRIPAGTVVTGKEHLYQSINQLIVGKCVLFCDNESKEMQAPVIFVSEPGSKKALFAIEDCIFQNILPNPDNVTDLEQIEQKYVITEPYQVALKESQKLIEIRSTL